VAAAATHPLDADELGGGGLVGGCCTALPMKIVICVFGS
jgi:hypothetical protein